MPSVCKESSKQLGFGLTFVDLYTQAGLEHLDTEFLTWLRAGDPDLCQQLLSARADGALSNESDFLVQLAPWVEDFLAEFFGLESEVKSLTAQSNELALVAKCKRQFIQRQAARKYSAEEAKSFDGTRLKEQLEQAIGETFTDLSFSRAVLAWLERPEDHEDLLTCAMKFAAWSLVQPQSSPLFRLPKKLNPNHLIEVENPPEGLALPDERCVERDGFDLTDPGVSFETAYLESHYCIWCHNQGKDSCRKGLKDPKTDTFKVNEHKVIQTGCPLDEKVSEMNLLRAQGHVLGALGVAMIDNPLLAGTGHRICNDCMKACIFQKQDPVNIPAVETQTLDAILALPYGFEIYSLLTRWNPLHIRRPLPAKETDYTVLVAGMGPAGYMLAHYLLNAGHKVVGIDGLKIEPLDEGLLDTSRPIKDINHFYENLSERVIGGFGGVAEYGITVRWNKNYLKVIRLLLERRQRFKLRGGVRLGGTLTLDDCQNFDHVALCMGAGRPNLIPMKNPLARGVRMASDFLMALQLTGAAKADSIANLQVRLPIAVIGGGLTAIDSATEALAYYPVQVEKFASRYEELVEELGEAKVHDNWTAEDHEIANEFLTHAQLLRTERDRATQEKRAPRIRELLQAWGGASVVYRKGLVDSPSYRLNHEEVDLALQQGVRFVEHHSPTEVKCDSFGYSQALACHTPDGEKELLAKTILVAAGTHPNTSLASENPGLELMGKYFQAVDIDGKPVTPEAISKPETPCVLLAHHGQVRMSFFGDLHPSYAGNVVKAMASAKQGYHVVDELLRSKPPRAKPNFFQDVSQRLSVRVHKVERLGPRIIEVVLEAPQAARNFQPGQFFRLQNYETYAPKVKGTRFAMEGLALTGAWVDREKGLVSTIILEMGGSSDLCAYLKPGEPCVLMGPTGTPTEIPHDETVLLVGGGLGNAVLFSIGKAMREKGCKILYVAGYRANADRFKIDEIEAAADQVIWCCDESPDFQPNRLQDQVYHGNIIDALAEYGAHPSGIKLEDVDRIITIGSDGMMHAVAQARHGVLQAFLKPTHLAIGSINSPMQCMMKEICAQCLQPHQDPVTGEASYTFSCTNQDQPLDWVDFQSLQARLSQNQLQEKLTALWIQNSLGSLNGL